MKPKHLLFALVFVLASCKVTRDDLIGTFSLKSSPTTRLILSKDSTFKFIKINKNPYLHPFEHPDQYFFITTGSWALSKDNKLVLNSTPNSKYSYIPAQVNSKTATSNESHFTFYDGYKMPINILFVQFPDSSTVALLHRSMPDFSFDLSKKDTIKFYFYGYPPYTHINNKKPAADYQILLHPNLNPTYFKNKNFRVHKKRIIDDNNGAIFQRLKNDSTFYQ